MARNKGTQYWINLVNKFNGKNLSDEDFKFCDSLEALMRTKSDKRILEYLTIQVTNDIQKESYFIKDMTKYINGAYNGLTDGEILKR